MSTAKQPKEDHLIAVRTTISMPKGVMRKLLLRASQTGFSDFSAYLQSLGREDINKGVVGPACPQLLTFAP